MKKRLFACLLAACLAVSVLVLPASAASLNNSAIQTAITLGAMDTRGAFAKMLVSFSAYRESASQQGNLGTLYKDVPGSSQWAPYVRIAVQQGWMNGYTDGTFRPDNTVTLEEACTAALKLLGYKMTDLNGVFPTAQLNKAQQIGLRDQLTCTQGQAMTYEQCTLLLYNALRANTASGSAYGSSLGFTVSNGQVDTSSVLLKSRKGPFVAEEGTQLPFTPVSVYRNDKTSASAELNKYDVYYYSESLQTVWIYTRRAAGRITAVSPSASAPTALTVAGSTYSLGSAAVASKISSLNGGGVGEVGAVVLNDRKLLAEDGMVVIVLPMSSHDHQLLCPPEIVTRGFVYVKESEELLEDMRRVATEAVDGMSAKKRRDEGDVCRTVRSAVSSYLYKHTKRSPMIIPMVTKL